MRFAKNISCPGFVEITEYDSNIFFFQFTDGSCYFSSKALRFHHFKIHCIQISNKAIVGLQNISDCISLVKRYGYEGINVYSAQITFYYKHFFFS